MCITTFSLGLNHGRVIWYSQQQKTVNLGAKIVRCVLEQIPTTKAHLYEYARHFSLLCRLEWLPERKKCVRKIKSSFVSVRLLPLSWFAPEIITAFTWFQPQLTKVISQASIYFFKDKFKLFKRWEFWKLAVTYSTSCPPFWHVSAWFIKEGCRWHGTMLANGRLQKRFFGKGAKV